MINLPELFKKHDGEYLEFGNVKKKLSSHPYVHAFLVLERALLKPEKKREEEQ